MSSSSSSDSVVRHIDAVDACARTLFVRAQQSPYPAIAGDVAQGVQQLHLALRHLHIQVADPDPSAAPGDGYFRRLEHIVGGSESAFKLLELVLDRHGAIGDFAVDGTTDGVSAVKAKLAKERGAIEAFLDHVQLGKGSSVDADVGLRNGCVNKDQPDLQTIKDKLDMVAQRLFTHRDDSLSIFTNDDDDLWRDFKAELEKEGFSSQVLQQHKDVLRAYIRELQSVSATNGGAPPTVQGLLDYETRESSLRSKSINTVRDNAESSPNVKQRRPALEEAPVPLLQKQFSYDRHPMTPEEINDEINQSLKFISTMDLIELDGPVDDMSDPHQHEARSRGASMSSPYSLHPGGDFELSRSSSSYSAAPRSFSQSQPSFPGPNSYRSTYSGRPSLHLAPDSHGRDIPMDAQWTKIKRTLVSPEVLDRAGLRYEARPEYVAVLGRLDRDQISHYARLSAECRAARMGKPPPAHHHHEYGHDRRNSDRHGDEDSDSYSSDTSEDEEYDRSDKGTKSYPIIVDPPVKQTTSPTSIVMPRPILKNKNSNHFRSNSEPYGHSEGYHSGRNDHDRRHHKHRDDRHKDDSFRRRSDDRRRRDDDGYRHRDRDDDGHKHHGSGRSRKSDRRSKRRVWGETLGAVGIGGAAVSLLGILAEAAVGG